MNEKNKTILILTLLVATVFCTYLIQAEAQTTRIVVSPSPLIINADGEPHEIIIVSLQTENGQPYIAPSDTPIHITSSNLNVGTVEEFITIPEGKSYAKAVFTTKTNSGITIITASSPGYTTGDEYLQVSKSNLNPQLVVYASPDTQPNVIGEKGKVVVQIMNYQGEPYVALEDIEVTLTSSNHTLFTVIQDLVIEKGTNYATTEFSISGTITGTATITAQAQGYTPGNDEVTVLQVAPVPEKVALFFNPYTLLSDGQVHESVTVQLQDHEGNPVKATADTVVYLSSSNTNVAIIDETIIIVKGGFKANANITTYTGNGASTISASSSGMIPATSTITVQGEIPSLLQLYIFPSSLVADGSENNIITVQFLNNEENPVPARRDTEIYLSSTNPSIGTVPYTVTIPAGSSYTTVTFTTSGVAGSTNILATMMGIVPSEQQLITITKLMNMTLLTPSTILINQTFTVQAQVSSGGLPVPGAIIEWTALGGVIISQDAATDEEGIATAQIVQQYDTLRLKATAIKTGYENKNVQKTIQVAQQIETDELTITILGRQILVFHILIALAVLIAIILAVYVYIKYRKTKQDEPEDLEIYS